MARCSWNIVSSFSALSLATLGLVGAAMSGCQGFSDLQDLELARNEARYVPTELGATLGLALVDAREYGAVSAEAQAAWIAGSPMTGDGCATVGILDAMSANDGMGAVRFDFPGCDGRSGAVIVSQDIELDHGDSGDSGEAGHGEAPELPEGSQADMASALDPIGATDASMGVTYAAYKNGMVRTAGTMQMTETGDVGTLDADLRISALDYSGDLDVTGDWSEMADGLTTRLNVTGSFISATGVDWTVVANNVGFEAGCMDGLGGTLTLVHDSRMGRVTVEAQFDDVCDGCATILVDGEEQASSCFGDGTNIGGF